MPIKREKKEKVVEEIGKAIKDSSSVVFVNFHKLSAGDATILRRNLRNQSVGYKVSRKTLLRRALKQANISGSEPSLDGEVSVAFSKDLIAPAREVYAFQKDHKENISILGGVFEGRFMSQAEMLSIATIPPIQVLYGQFVNLINSPIQGLVIALNAVAEKKQ